MSDSGRALNWNATEPCQFCGHLHPYVVCAVCGCLRHHPPVGFDPSPVQSINPTEIVHGLLFLGDNSNASRVDHLRTLGITRKLNISSPFETVFQEEVAYGIELIEQCQREGQSVLVYCMTGINRSPAIIIGFLMKRMRWTLEQSYQYVRGRRPSVNIEDGTYICLLMYQQIIMASNNNFPLRTAATSSLPNARGVRPNLFISGAGQANQAYFMANQANPNAAGSSRIVASNYNFQPTAAPTTSFRNAGGVRRNYSFLNGLDAYVRANPANQNAAGSSRIVASNSGFLPTTAPTTSFPSRVPSNELITEAGQATEASIMTRPAYPTNSDRILRSTFTTLLLGTGDSPSSSVPPNEFIYGAGQATEASFMANQANPNAAGSSRIVASNSGSLPTTAPITSFPSRVPPNELVTEAGQASGSSRNLRPSFRAVLLGTGDRPSSSVPPNPNAATHRFGNAEGVPSPTSSAGSSNSTVESSPPKELITGSGQGTTEASSAVDRQKK